MIAYSEYRPSQFDIAGLNAPDQQHWLVLIGRNRDSGMLSESNWATALKCIEDKDPESDHHEVLCFGHWACGWLEVLIIDPDFAPVMTEATDIEGALADYPILDDSDHSERLAEFEYQHWKDWECGQFEKTLLPLLSEIAHDTITQADHDEMREFWHECGGEVLEEGEENHSPAYNDPDPTRDQLAAMVRKMRKAHANSCNVMRGVRKRLAVSHG